LIKIVDEQLKTLNLSLNKEKIKVMKRNQKQIITGILVNDVLQVPKKERQFIRQEIYYIQKFGLVDHLKKTKNKRSNYIPHLLGKINFVLFVNPKDKEMLRYKDYIQELFKQ
jgi:RNA-directed DNA polymerase